MRPFRAICLLVCLNLAILSPRHALAHGDLHERIAELTVQIKGDPRNAELYFQRGELHRQHGETSLALSDFNEAERKGLKSAAIHLARGKTLLDAGKFTSAKTAICQFISAEKNSAEGLSVLAKIQAQLGEYAEAADDFTRAIENANAPDPDWFLQRAEMQIALGKYDDALRGLDAGLEKIGPIISLQLRAIELETVRKNYDAALKRLQTVQDRFARKETWLAQRARILEQAGRFSEAKKTCDDALQALNSLPATRRNVPAMASLEIELQSRLNRLKSSVATISQKN